MTLAKISTFNKYMKTNIQYYNCKDRHIYPRNSTNDDDMILYLYKEHFCLINKNNKAAGIKEIEENYNKYVEYTRCDSNRVKKRDI